MDKNPPHDEGNELWRLLQGDAPTPAPAPEPPPVPLPPEERAQVKPFPDPDYRGDDQQSLDATKPNPGSDNYIAQDSSAPVGPVNTDTTMLQRILSSSDLPADLDYTRGSLGADDVDDTVRGFNRTAGEVIHCKNHPELESVAQCPVCQAFFCQACLIVRRGRLICRDCAEAEYAPTEEEILAAQELGLEAPPADTQITEKEHPEFELGSGMFGGEGTPTNTLMQCVAWLLDFALVRGFLLLAVWLLGALLHDNPHPLLHMFDGETGAARQSAVINTLLLGGLPSGTWLSVLPVLVLLDFLYQFITLGFFNRTTGMSWAGMRIVTEWGDYASFGAVAARSAVYSVLQGLPAVLIGAFFPDTRGPHDMAAGTLVVNYSGIKRVDAYETLPIKRPG
jgi:uncharacterized RDD family membrane protein YckC